MLVKRTTLRNKNILRSCSNFSLSAPQLYVVWWSLFGCTAVFQLFPLVYMFSCQIMRTGTKMCFCLLMHSFNSYYMSPQTYLTSMHCIIRHTETLYFSSGRSSSWHIIGWQRLIDSVIIFYLNVKTQFRYNRTSFIHDNIFIFL